MLKKEFCGVHFLKLPCKIMEWKVCVPRSWIRSIEPISGGWLADVAYPNEYIYSVKERVKRKEMYSDKWKIYKCCVKIESDSYSAVDKWCSALNDTAISSVQETKSATTVPTMLPSSVPSNSPQSRSLKRPNPADTKDQETLTRPSTSKRAMVLTTNPNRLNADVNILPEIPISHNRNNISNTQTLNACTKNGNSSRILNQNIRNEVTSEPPSKASPTNDKYIQKTNADLIILPEIQISQNWNNISNSRKLNVQMQPDNSSRIVNKNIRNEETSEPLSKASQTSDKFTQRTNNDRTQEIRKVLADTGLNQQKSQRNVAYVQPFEFAGTSNNIHTIQDIQQTLIGPTTITRGIRQDNTLSSPTQPGRVRIETTTTSERISKQNREDTTLRRNGLKAGSTQDHYVSDPVIENHKEQKYTSSEIHELITVVKELLDTRKNDQNLLTKELFTSLDTMKRNMETVCNELKKMNETVNEISVRNKADNTLLSAYNVTQLKTNKATVKSQPNLQSGLDGKLVPNWALKHFKGGPKLVELMNQTNIFVNKFVLENIKLSSEDSETLAKKLLVAVFNEQALSECSLEGTEYYEDGRTKRPLLPEQALVALILFVLNYASEKGWSFNMESVRTSIINKMQEIRAGNH